MEEWISLNAYMKKFQVGYREVKRMIKNHEVEYRQTEGGHYKIKIGGDTVSRELYEVEKAKRIEAETKLNLLRKILGEGKNNEDY